MTTPKEIVRKTLRFERPERVAMRLAPDFANDFAWIGMDPSVDARPLGAGRHTDEWGTVWNNIGVCNLGEACEFPLADWENFNRMNIPDVEDPKRWRQADEAAKTIDRDKFILGAGISIYERVHFLRGLENTWMDIYLEPENLKKLIALLVDMNLKNIRKLAAYGVDGYVFCDDWGLQNKLMIDPAQWREFWFPAYREIYTAAHAAGMATFLHSCGYITDILGDLIEAGLDAILMDQQLNMGLEPLSHFAGRVTFVCPVDIQSVMPRNDLGEIRRYCHTMFEKLATPEGGFIADFYGDPKGAGHTPEAVQAMCEEFELLRYRVPQTK